MPDYIHIGDIIAVFVMVAVGAALAVLWYLRLRHLDRLPAGLAKLNIKSIVNKALHELNVKAEWSKDGENDVAHYTYQGGHFNILLEKDSPYARLTFLYFYQADVSRIESVRATCNLCNLNTDACRIVYTVNEKGGKVDVHLISVLPVNYKDMKDNLERVMGDAFRWQNTFVQKMEAEGKGKMAEADKEKAHAQYERDLQLIREQEMTHQDAGPDWHENYEQPFTLRGLLSTAMGLTDVIPLKLTLVIDGETTEMDDPDEILAYPVSRPLINAYAFSHLTAFGMLEFYDPRDPVALRHLTLDFEQAGSTTDTLFYRVTLSLSPLSAEKEAGEHGEQRRQLANSVLLGYDLTPAADRLARFRYVWKEAMAKVQNDDTKNLTHDEKVLADMKDPHLAYNFYHGRDLYLRKRYYEALLPLATAFHTVTEELDHDDRHVANLLDELAYFIGCSYMNLHQYERAAYYLQLTLPTTHQSYTEAYVNCLVNGDDYRAMDVINSLLGGLQQMLKLYDNEEEDDEEEAFEPGEQQPARTQLQAFVNFLKRRKAYLLINRGEYDEAERLLKQLLNDPDNSDFALNELAYIQKQKG